MTQHGRAFAAFARVEALGRKLPGVEATTKYDGSPVLKREGCFMAGMAMHSSAEPDTLVVRVGCEDRGWLLEEAPDTYYVTDYYQGHPVVLIRLSRIGRDALEDVLSMSWRETAARSRQAIARRSSRSPYRF
jgi:hypothetical protein